MQMASADRSFMLLLACAVTAVVALGAATDHGLGSERSDTPSPPARPGGATRAIGAAPPTHSQVPPRPGSVLEHLLSTRPNDPFLRQALRETREPSILADSQIISYYGNPYTAKMGILGAADAETVASQLQGHAARYDRLNGPTSAVPALHLVYAVAQPHPTDNGLYLQYVEDAVVRRLLTVTEERGMLLFLDLQIGRSSVEAEVEKVLPYLRHSHVHLAIDPEFAVGAGDVPGIALGSVEAADIDQAQATLQKLVERESLPPKLLIVHQFVDSMVMNGNSIERYPDVELVIDMDGFGQAAVKRVIYEQYAARPYASRAGIKLFFEQDPDLMSEEEVLLLEPRPSVIIYQ